MHAPCILDNHEQLHDLGEDLVEGGDDVAVVRLLHLQLVLVSGRVVELHATAEQAKISKHTRSRACRAQRAAPRAWPG